VLDLNGGEECHGSFGSNVGTMVAMEILQAMATVFIKEQRLVSLLSSMLIFPLAYLKKKTFRSLADDNQFRSCFLPTP